MHTCKMNVKHFIYYELCHDTDIETHLDRFFLIGKKSKTFTKESNWYLAGITSFGLNMRCDGNGSLFVRTSFYYDWIVINKLN